MITEESNLNVCISLSPRYEVGRISPSYIEQIRRYKRGGYSSYLRILVQLRGQPIEKVCCPLHIDPRLPAFVIEGSNVAQKMLQLGGN